MKYTKTYNILNKFIHIITPLTILIYSYFVNLGYNEIDDPGGWGGLALAGNIIISIVWILAILFIVFLCNSFCKKESSKGIIKLVISILNILIWGSNANFLIVNEIIFTMNIFLVIITGILLLFCETRTNKPKNITRNYDIKKEERINLKQKTKLYRIFIVFSVLICIFLLPFVNSMTSKFPTAYPGNEASSGVITSEIANQISIYVWPILIVYLIMLIILIIKKNNYRKVYYPLSLFTLTVIIFNLGIIYSGYMTFLYLIILFYPLIALIIVLSIIGNKLDNNTITAKKVLLILGISLLVILLAPILIFAPNFIENKIEDNIYIEEKIENKIEDNIYREEKTENKYENIKNQIKEEFNDLLDNNFISINDLKLSEDYGTIKRIELLITTDNVPNNEMDFCNKLIDSYNDIKGLLNKYNYTSQTIDFKFKNNNPFAKEGATNYKSSGYISDAVTLYLIYLNPTPLKINKYLKTLSMVDNINGSC